MTSSLQYGQKIGQIVDSGIDKQQYSVVRSPRYPVYEACPLLAGTECLQVSDGSLHTKKHRDGDRSRQIAVWENNVDHI